eukprot:m.141759 g.141759  ORF g.141759 m.141759 type:complete len:786 (+) comp14861_c1_seq1:166-2523(+)
MKKLFKRKGGERQEVEIDPTGEISTPSKTSVSFKDEEDQAPVHAVSSFGGDDNCDAWLCIHVHNGVDMAPMDKTGFSDPYAVFTIGKKSAKTKEERETLSPEWNEELILPLVAVDGEFPNLLSFEVYDWDGKVSSIAGRDDYMGGGMVDIDAAIKSPGTPLDFVKAELQNLGTKGKSSKKLQKRGGGGSTAAGQDEIIKEGNYGAMNFTVTVEYEQKTAKKSSAKTRWLTVDVLSARDLCPISKKGKNDPLVEVRLGGRQGKKAGSVHVTKPAINTLKPHWNQRFEFELMERQYSLSFIVYNGGTGHQHVMGKALLPLRVVPGFRNVEDENGFNHYWLPLSPTGDLGSVLVAVSIVDYLETRPLIPVSDRKNTPAFLSVIVEKANNIRAADLNGKSDPFCVVEVGEQRMRTETIPKTVHPFWRERIMEFPIVDIFGHCDFKVYDQDKGGKAEFLGGLRIPLSEIPILRESETLKETNSQVFALKDKQYLQRSKGELSVKMRIELFDEWGARQGIFGRVPNKPREGTGKFKIKFLSVTTDRLKRLSQGFVMSLAVITKLLKWEYGFFASTFAALVFVYICQNFEIWMLPFLLLVIFLVQLVNGESNSELVIPQSTVAPTYDEDDTSESSESEEETAAPEKKSTSLTQKWKELKDIGQKVQEILGTIASSFERLSNLISGEVPMLTLVLAILLIIVSFVLYLIDIRHMISAGGVGAFAGSFFAKYVSPMLKKPKRKKKKGAASPNLAMEFLARVPSKADLLRWKRLPPQTMSRAAARRGVGDDDENG